MSDEANLLPAPLAEVTGVATLPFDYAGPLGQDHPRVHVQGALKNHCLIPEPVGVPVIVAALTIAAPSFVLFHSASSGLLWVICNVRK